MKLPKTLPNMLAKMPATLPEWFSAQKLAVRIPYGWLIVFFLVPLLVVLRISLSHPVAGQPPYAPVFSLWAGWHGIKEFFGTLSLDNFRLIGSAPIYLMSVIKSLKIAAFSTLLLLVIGYPLAYGITRTPRVVQAVLMTLVMLPFFVAVLIRGYAWMNILQLNGPLNGLLAALHIVGAPPNWLGTDTAIYLGIVYSYLPLMVLPLYLALDNMDETLREAAADLGCPRWKVFWRLTLPLSAAGVVMGALLCFIAALGEFVIPDLLGNARAPMLGQTIWIELFGNKDWPAAAAVTIVLIGLLLTPMAALQYQAIRAARRS